MISLSMKIIAAALILTFEVKPCCRYMVYRIFAHTGEAYCFDSLFLVNLN